MPDEERIRSAGAVDPGHAQRVIRWLNGQAKPDELWELEKYFATYFGTDIHQLDLLRPVVAIRRLINTTHWGMNEPEHKVTARACAALSPPGYSYGWNKAGILNRFDRVIEVPSAYCRQAWVVWQEHRPHVSAIDGPKEVARVDRLIAEWQALK